MSTLQKYFPAFLLALLSQAAFAQAPNLGTAANFAVLGGPAVTCTTSSLVVGDVGVSPGAAFTNTVCVVAGTVHAGDAVAAKAQADFQSAYTALQSQTRSCIQMPGNLAGKNLQPGVYCTDAVAKAGTLTLTGPANGVWIFLVNGALTGTNFTVVMAGGGQPCNVFWAPTAAATMTTSAFKGNILAGTAAITLTGGTLAGRVLANAAVTMTDASLIGCSASGALLAPSGLVSSLSCKGKKHKGKEHKGKERDGRDDDDDDDDDDDNDKDRGHSPTPFGKKGK